MARSDWLRGRLTAPPANRPRSCLAGAALPLSAQGNSQPGPGSALLPRTVHQNPVDTREHRFWIKDLEGDACILFWRYGTALQLNLTLHPTQGCFSIQSAARIALLLFDFTRVQLCTWQARTQCSPRTEHSLDSLHDILICTMEDDRALVDVGIAADIEQSQTAQNEVKQPKKRFVGRRAAEAARSNSNSGSASIEDSGAIQGSSRLPLRQTATEADPPSQSRSQGGHPGCSTKCLQRS